MVNILCAVLLGPGYGLGAAFGGLCAYPIGIVISGVLIYTLKKSNVLHRMQQSIEG